MSMKPRHLWNVVITCIYVLFGECVVTREVGDSQDQMHLGFWEVGTNSGSHFFAAKPVTSPAELWFTQWGTCCLNARSNSFSRGSKANHKCQRNALSSPWPHKRLSAKASWMFILWLLGMTELGIASAIVSQRREAILVKKEYRSLSDFIQKSLWHNIRSRIHHPARRIRKENSWVNWDAESLNNILHNYWSKKEMLMVCLISCFSRREAKKPDKDRCKISFLKKDIIYLFLEKRKRRDWEGERHQCVVASHTPPTRDLACNLGMCPDWESNQWPFGLQASAQSTEPHQPGLDVKFLFQESQLTMIDSC